MSSPILRYFDYAHLRDGPMKQTSVVCHQMAHHMEASLPDGPEKSAGLRKLLEAKDCFVRAALPEQESKR